MLTGLLNPVSNKATWAVTYELRDDDTDELIDLSNIDEIVVEVRDIATKSSMLSAKLSDASIVIESTGIFSWQFSSDQMRTLCQKMYEVGVTITEDDETAQLLIGKLPVLDGIVT
jgi:hypothetical protein